MRRAERAAGGGIGDGAAGRLHQREAGRARGDGRGVSSGHFGRGQSSVMAGSARCLSALLRRQNTARSSAARGVGRWKTQFLPNLYCLPIDAPETGLHCPYAAILESVSPIFWRFAGRAEMARSLRSMGAGRSYGRGQVSIGDAEAMKRSKRSSPFRSMK